MFCVIVFVQFMFRGGFCHITNERIQTTKRKYHWLIEFKEYFANIQKKIIQRVELEGRINKSKKKFKQYFFFNLKLLDFQKGGERLEYVSKTKNEIK